MLPIIVVAGLVVLFLAAKSSGGSGGSTQNVGPNTNTGLPDPGATPVAMPMVGQAAQMLPPANSIVPFPGTSMLSPGTSFARMNVANRIAARGVGQPLVLTRVPPPPSVSTTNPAVVPVSATGTRSFSGALAITSASVQGVKI